MLGVLKVAEQWLDRHGVDAPRRSIELLLCHVLGIGRLQLYLLHDRPLDEGERTRLRTLVARRARGEPLAYLLQQVDFCGIQLHVDAAVLIPRPETEELVERVVAVAAPDGVVADLGTGSGAIAIAVALRRPDLRLLAVELSSDAMKVARRNAAHHGVSSRLEFREQDFAVALCSEDRCSVVVSNPPYVDPARPELLAEDVRRFEPGLALFTKAGDPASASRAVLAAAERGLLPGGHLLLETGVGAAEAMEALLRATPWLGDVEMARDLAGWPRILSARRTLA